MPAADTLAAPEGHQVLAAPDEVAAEDGFAALGVGEPLLATLAGLGYEEPTPIQREAIPLLLAGRDLLAQAPTGTGKTAAFALPILAGLDAGRPSGGPPSALVVVPTRELAMQVAEAFQSYGRALGLRVVPVYGGQPIHQQLRGLGRGVDVVVATPGRAVDHLSRRSLNLGSVRVVVLDEADEMLDMGFAEDLDTILAATPPERQTVLFSATISPTIAKIARRHLREPARVSVHAEHGTRDGVARVRQTAYVVRRPDKLAALCRILDVEDPTSALVFARTRGEVDDLAQALSGRGHDAGALHGGLAQESRDRMMGRFRDGSLDVLVATDVAARGLDIDHVSHVVNYDVPSDPDQYVHRIGRTGRAGRDGVAITLVEPREHRLLRNIETATRTKLLIERLPTVADLRERRAEVTRGNLREALLAGGHDRFRGVVEPLSEEFDLVDIALAAVSLVDGAAGSAADEVELAPAFLNEQGGHRPSAGGPPGARFGKRPPEPGRPGPGHRAGESFTPPRGSRGGRADSRPAPQSRLGPRGARPSGPMHPSVPDGDWVQLWVGGGRRAGLRPGDLVGAIANEAGVPGSVVGAIQIFDDFALVDVQSAVVDGVADALRRARIRGQQVAVRRERPG
ncbi:MAG: DEAD/DEAH box helicase [Chloroflexota bacterium]|nr:MAG: DEAD/DEAH box helicase [Chloroflexota bacterium]